METEKADSTGLSVPTARPARESKAKIVNEKLNDISHIEDDDEIDPEEGEVNTYRNA